MFLLRLHDRPLDQMRPLSLEVNVTKYAEGSCLVKFGDTHVLCTASIEENTPKWLAGKGEGWITAEYSMLPRSTHQRIQRQKALTGGRSQEISRLIGRALRSGFDLKKMPEKSIMVDCDVLQADGGTRTAAVTGGFIAVKQALNFLLKQNILKEDPTRFLIAAVSVGKMGENIHVDLDFEEDAHCDCDVNFVMNSEMDFIEIQGTAEKQTFNASEFQKMMDVAQRTCAQIFETQRKFL